MRKEYVIQIPVIIEADDPESEKAAKQYLRRQVARIEAGANTGNLMWSISTLKPSLRNNHEQ